MRGPSGGLNRIRRSCSRGVGNSIGHQNFEPVVWFHCSRRGLRLLGGRLSYYLSATDSGCCHHHCRLLALASHANIGQLLSAYRPGLGGARQTDSTIGPVRPSPVAALGVRMTLVRRVHRGGAVPTGLSARATARSMELQAAFALLHSLSRLVWDRDARVVEQAEYLSWCCSLLEMGKP